MLHVHGLWATLVEALFTAQLTFEYVNDLRPALAGVGSIMWGSTLLAFVNTTSDIIPVGILSLL